MSDLDTDREAVEPRHLQPEVHGAMSDRDDQKHEQTTATTEAKECSTIEAGETLHGVALVPLSTTYTILGIGLHHPCHNISMYVLCAIDMLNSRESLWLL